MPIGAKGRVGIRADLDGRGNATRWFAFCEQGDGGLMVSVEAASADRPVVSEGGSFRPRVYRAKCHYAAGGNLAPRGLDRALGNFARRGFLLRLRRSIRRAGLWDSLSPRQACKRDTKNDTGP